MAVKLPIELEIKLKINDFDNKDIGEKKFKPKDVDEKLGNILYFTEDYELNEETLGRAGFKGVEDYREVLSNKSKMREFLFAMGKNDKAAKAKQYAKQSVKEAEKKLEKAKNDDADKDEIERLEKLLEDEKNRKKSLKPSGDEQKKINKERKEITEANLKFVLKVFFKSKTKIKISPNSFIIYSSNIGDGVMKTDHKKKKREEFDVTIKTITINQKIYEDKGKDKVNYIDLAKVGCKERAERIEKDVFELLGISVDLFQQSNEYNPLNIYNKLREDSVKKDVVREERDRIALEKEREKREEKDAKKRAKKKLKEERDKRRDRIREGTVDYEEEYDEEDSDDDDDDDLGDYDSKEELTKAMTREFVKKKKKEKKEGKKHEMQKGGYRYKQNGGYKYKQKGGYKYKKIVTRRKSQQRNKRKTRKNNNKIEKY